MKTATAILAALSSFLTVPEAAAQGLRPQEGIQALLQHVLSSRPATTGERPNFVFVITDDQDLELDSVSYTPLIQQHLKGRGTFFKNHFVTTAICCPSRVSLWTGRQAHNTNVTDVSPPYGLFPLPTIYSVYKRQTG